MIVDTNVFIRYEKSGHLIDLSRWAASETVFVSTVTVSELLIGVHRANTEERKRQRSLFVEMVIASVSVLDFDLAAARLHAELAKSGKMIGAHDLIIAAIARCHDLSILTSDVTGLTHDWWARGLGYAACSNCSGDWYPSDECRRTRL